MAEKSPPPKRANRAVQLGDMLGNTLDPALRRRGFASRDLIANWASIAPTPYDTVSAPDKLVWPRRDRPDPEGAVLYLRCREGQALALTHEAPAITAAVNRYFGYLLVSRVKLSPNPLTTSEPNAPIATRALPPEKAAQLAQAVSNIEDEDLRAALEKLGRGVLGKKVTLS
ncbi:DUF721 domain-containing protein [Pelagibacterium limicola]|uniref:DUF721 domain-containing protein n=1 Tax=Pelagibacterium limicola TaxID=2791022 RepID=UPI0018AF58B2|nr:DciA family protein [Pelagibacterium limicola]